MKLRNLFLILLTITFSFPALAVTEKEMEEAKVAAAKLYLRWANNGSGYLDEVTASSMADLESKLKTQEKENLKAFKSVNIPADYASWDKQRFVQFWGTTFFTSPALSADGKRAKDRVKAKVSAMNVSAPTAAPTPAAAPAPETPQPEANAESENPSQEEASKAQTPVENPISIPEPTEVTHQEEALADSLQMIQAEEESMARAERPEKGKSNTWIYVVILIVLVILVVWLMVYAANMMKKQNSSEGRAERNDSSSRGNNGASDRREAAAAMAAIEKLKEENGRLKSQLDAAKAENARLKSEAPAPAKRGAMASAIADAMQPKEEPQPKPQPKVLNEIFLGRANPKGQFVRGDRRPNPDHTIYRLDTKDGIVGTFRFAETPEAFALATSNPLQYLAGGCICENFEDAETADRIITEAPGTAVLENGCWKVLRKSKIRFE